MTSREFNDRLARRAAKARVPVPSEVVEPLETYFRLLARWNVKINLTALPLQRPNDETFDRLFVEPLVAATLVTASQGTWFDLGSGGGSPAFPLKLVRPGLALTLIESKTRKAAFLREVTRVLQLPATDVANVRFEEFAAAGDSSADLLTARAVRPDQSFFKVAGRLTKVGGRLFLFGKPAPHVASAEFEREPTRPKPDPSVHVVTSFTRVFHVEQSR